MKLGIRFIAFALMLFSMACGAKKSTQSNMENNQQDMMVEGTDESQGDMARDDSAMETGDMDGSDSAMQGSGTAAAGNADEYTETIEAPVSQNINYLEMYDKLEMTDTQIQRFETALREFHAQKRTTASGEMMGSLSDERERQLKEILSEAQYSAYESWKNAN